MPAYKTPKHFPGLDKLPPLARALTERLFPADELPMPMVSIGPKAIPLDDELGYMKKVLGETFADMGDVGKRLYHNSKVDYRLIPPQVKNIFGNIVRDSDLTAKQMAAELDPELVKKFTSTAADRNPEWAKHWIQKLANAFMPEY